MIATLLLNCVDFIVYPWRLSVDGNDGEGEIYLLYTQSLAFSPITQSRGCMGLKINAMW